MYVGAALSPLTKSDSKKVNMIWIKLMCMPRSACIVYDYDAIANHKKQTACQGIHIVGPPCQATESWTAGYKRLSR